MMRLRRAFSPWNRPRAGWCAAAVVFGCVLIVAGPRVDAAQGTGTESPMLALRAPASALPQLRSLLVSWRGNLVGEYHAPGVRPSAPANVKSVSKSIISTLVGIAIERKLIPGVREPIVTYFPELRQDVDKRKQTITVEDLLTMRSGLGSTSGRNYGAWVRSGNWVRAALVKPLVSEPGTDMEYSTGTSHLLSAILTKASRTSTWAFAQEALGKPLGISIPRWTRDPQGIFFGGNEMVLTPKQMVTLGELYLNRGRHASRQVVPEAWVETSCMPRTRSVFDGTREYGYGWWIQRFQGGTACFAWGYGGQYIMVFGDLDLVVVATSSTAVSEERRGHRRRLFDLIEQHVLRPINGENFQTR